MADTELLNQIIERYRACPNYSDTGKSVEHLKVGDKDLGFKEAPFATTFSRGRGELTFECAESGQGSRVLKVGFGRVEIIDVEASRVAVMASLDDAILNLLLSSRGASALVPSLLLNIHTISPLLELTCLEQVGKETIDNGSACLVLTGVHPRQGLYRLWIDDASLLIRRLRVEADQTFYFAPNIE